MQVRGHWAESPQVTGAASVNIRKFVLKAARLVNDLVRLGSMPPQAARFLEAAVLAGQNIVVAGGTQPASNQGCSPRAVPLR